MPICTNKIVIRGDSIVLGDRRLRTAWVKEQKSPRGEILLLPECRRGVAIPKHKECFDRCGGRLKKLFEKSFLRIFKNFIAAVLCCQGY
jgi:hypothetical protein